MDQQKIERSNQRMSRRIEYAQERFPLLPVELCFYSFVFEVLLEAPLPDDVRECATIDRFSASNLEMLGRGLAAIGNFFVFDCLSFVECRKASFLDRRNMNKNILAAT